MGLDNTEKGRLVTTFAGMYTAVIVNVEEVEEWKKDMESEGYRVENLIATPTHRMHDRRSFKQIDVGWIVPSTGEYIMYRFEDIKYHD